jgi:hypothetical protein
LYTLGVDKSDRFCNQAKPLFCPDGIFEVLISMVPRQKHKDFSFHSGGGPYLRHETPLFIAISFVVFVQIYPIIFVILPPILVQNLEI